jgi:WD40 repeat protein
MAPSRRGKARDWQPSLRVWDVESGKELRRFVGVADTVRCLAWSPDGRFVAAGHSADLRRACPGTLRLWDVDTGKETRTFNGHTSPISSVAFSPNGKMLLTSGSYDHTVRLWDVETGKELQRFRGPAPALAEDVEFTTFEQAVFTPDGRRVLACGNGYDPHLRLWDVATGVQLHESGPVPKGFFCVAALPDGQRCVTTGADGVVRLWHWKK